MTSEKAASWSILIINWECLKSDRVRTSSRTSPGRPYPPDASHASTIDRSPKVRTLDQSVRDLVGTTPRYPLIDKPTWVLSNNTCARGSRMNCPPKLTNWRSHYPLTNWIMIWELTTSDNHYPTKNWWLNTGYQEYWQLPMTKGDTTP